MQRLHCRGGAALPAKEAKRSDLFSFEARGRGWQEQVDDRVGVGFVRLEVAPAEARGHLFVEVGGARVQVERGFDAKLLRAVVDALGSES